MKDTLIIVAAVLATGLLVLAGDPVLWKMAGQLTEPAAISGTAPVGDVSVPRYRMMER